MPNLEPALLDPRSVVTVALVRDFQDSTDVFVRSYATHYAFEAGISIGVFSEEFTVNEQFSTND